MTPGEGVREAMQGGHSGSREDRHSRRIEPMSRSANGVCQGLCGAVRTSIRWVTPEDAAIDLAALARLN
jgi:hypothetical protein